MKNWNITRQMIARFVNSIDSPLFDTHQVECGMLRRHTLEFARDLLEFDRPNTDALNLFSMQFSKRIGREFPNDIRRMPHKIQSLNLAQETVENQQWEKVHPLTSITEI